MHRLAVETHMLRRATENGSVGMIFVEKDGTCGPLDYTLKDRQTNEPEATTIKENARMKETRI